MENGVSPETPALFHFPLSILNSPFFRLPAAHPPAAVPEGRAGALAGDAAGGFPFIPVPAAAGLGAVDAVDADHQVAAVVHAQRHFGLFAGSAGIVDGHPLALPHGRGPVAPAAGVVKQLHLHAGAPVAGRSHAGIQGHVLIIHILIAFQNALLDPWVIYTMPVRFSRCIPCVILIFMVKLVCLVFDKIRRRAV